MKWKGYDNTHNSWEKEQDIDGDLIEAYENQKEEVKVFTDFFVEWTNPFRTVCHFPARTAMVFNPVDNESKEQEQQRKKEELSYLKDLASINNTATNYNFLKTCVKFLLMVKKDISTFLDINTNYLNNRVGVFVRRVREHPALMAYVGVMLKIPPYAMDDDEVNND